jgi:S1-C subfamily serine protease
MARHVIPQLIEHGRIVRGYLGLHARVVPISPDLVAKYELTQKYGVEVLGVENGAPAADAGLEEGDVVFAFGDRPVTSVDDLHKLLTTLPVGLPASVAFFRNERWMERLVIPEEYPVA